MDVNILKIDVTIDVGGEKLPFWIKSDTLLEKMKLVLENTFGMEIINFLHYESKTSKSFKEMNDFSKYLIEDYNVKNGNYIKIIGNYSKKEPDFSMFTTAYLLFNGSEIPFQIIPTTAVYHLYQVIKDNLDMVPNTIKLKYKGKILTDMNQILMKDLGIKENDKIEMSGITFPSHLFNPNVTFLENK